MGILKTRPCAERLIDYSRYQQCLNAKGQGVEEWETQIDNRVAHLYGFTDKEMNIIKGE